MNKNSLLMFILPVSFLLAATPSEIIKKDFNSKILPQIVKDLDKNGESIVILRIYKTQKSVTLKTYKVQQTLSVSELLVKEGDYSQGYKYYTKYILKPSQIKVTDFVKIIGAKTDKDLDELFANNAEKLIQVLKEQKQFIAVKGLEKIIKKDRLNDLKAFLKGVLAGKVPASCS
ncbi:putative annexin [Nautilia profundicola AmH]|uniref:Annexin n=1 Tax=Nautilia profundicola (strain ATCC BAA-1463 / DSM 18972 / AmH) TaxID=598659 RepID=B9L813_NAUPA|nr:hypothetical protein [Nautilia profundicola]ACM93416.1 putative annexin [Nautilia profundicola AmH]